MENPLISIIVPVFNVENYIVQCVESLINQTYKNIEVILIDDGSKDNSSAIIEKFVQQDQRIRFFKQTNKGLSATRNFGITHCQGKYLMFVDSDDWLELNTCESLISKLSENDFDVIFWSYLREYKHTSLPKDILKESEFFNEEKSRKLLMRLFGLSGKDLENPENADSIVTACMKLYKTEIIKNNNIFFVDTKIIGTEDALFNIYYFYHVKNAYYIHQYFYHYRRDNLNSLTSIYRPDLIHRWDNLYQYMDKAIVDYNLNKDFKKALKNRIAIGIIGVGLNEMASDKNKIRKISGIKSILSKPNYKDALAQLDLKYFPLKWKLFFLSAKMNNSFCLYMLLSTMNFIINRNKK